MPGMKSSAQKFATTHWSWIQAARDGRSSQARDALASLCAAYWYPLYAFVRHSGHKPHDAQDLTQAFFLRLLEKDYLRTADRARGRFRSFLLASLKHFLCNEYDSARARKRGGGRAVLSLDLDDAETRYRREPAHQVTPERLFERRWALTLLDQVLDRLRAEWTDADKQKLFEALKPLLTGEKSAESYGALAMACATTEGAIKVHVHRLRRRYRELLREEIGRTLQDPGQVDEEIQELFGALGL
jgi:RNA polymerase sigma-70 factor (ECF subfamily)